jgi:hypothetical protein
MAEDEIRRRITTRAAQATGPAPNRAAEQRRSSLKSQIGTTLSFSRKKQPVIGGLQLEQFICGVENLFLFSSG